MLYIIFSATGFVIAWTQTELAQKIWNLLHKNSEPVYTKQDLILAAVVRYPRFGEYWFCPFCLGFVLTFILGLIALSSVTGSLLSAIFMSLVSGFSALVLLQFLKVGQPGQYQDIPKKERNKVIEVPVKLPEQPMRSFTGVPRNVGEQAIDYIERVASELRNMDKNDPRLPTLRSEWLQAIDAVNKDPLYRTELSDLEAVYAEKREQAKKRGDENWMNISCPNCQNGALLRKHIARMMG
jgi:hypothetical protein